MIKFREFKKDDWRDARYELSLQLSQRCQYYLFPKSQSSKFSLDKYLEGCLGSVEGRISLKSSILLLVGSQKLQVSHFYSTGWHESEPCRAPWTLAVLALDRNAGFTIFPWRQTQLVKVLSTAVASPYSHPAGFFRPSLGLCWECGCSTNTSSETRPPGICFRDRTRSSPSHLQSELRTTTAPTNNCGCYKNCLLVTFQ